MNFNEILQNLPVGIYLASIKIKKDDIQIVNFELIKVFNFTGYSEEEFRDIKIISQAFKKDELQKYINALKELPVSESFTITYSFKKKSGEIVYFKDYLKLIEVNDDVYTFLGVVIDISKEHQLLEIFNSIYKSPFIGILIYKDKVLLADDTLKKMYEIGDEIYNLNPLDLISDKHKDLAKKYLEKRLKGEKFSQFYAFELKTFKNKRFFAELFADTIFYENGYAGLVFFIDKTKLYRQNILLKLLVDIDDVIVKSNNENKLLEDIKKVFENCNYFSEIRMNEKFDNKEIEVNDLDGKYKSYLYLPIIVDNKIVASYSFYSVYRNDFPEEVVSTFRDIQYKMALAVKNIKFQKTLTILKNAIDKSYQWCVITDKDKKIIYANDAVENISGYKKNELIGKNPNIFKSGFHNDEFYKRLWDTLTNGEIFNDIFVNRDINGHIFYLKDKIIPVKIDDDNYYVSLGVDITKQKVLEKEVSALRYKDKLTNLYNRDGFLFYGAKRLKENKNYALFIIDIDEFKLFNELKGNKYGDLVLKEFAKFLEDIFYKDDLISRIGNDEFAVLIEYNDSKMLTSILNKLIEKVKQKKDELPISIKIGISLYPQDAKNIKELLEKAYTALSFIKKMNDEVYQFYNKNLSNEIEKYMQVKNLLHNAIKNDQFVFFYQPYVNCRDCKFVGAESLIRIKNEDKIISPALFIDYAERSGIIKKIELIMIEKLINSIKESNFPISFNLSGISLKDMNHIKKIIELSKDYSEFITFEITERELIEDLNFTAKMFDVFKNNGYKIAIDDFGTGYSSLTYISSLPIDIIKIDISFIKDIETNQKNLVIVDTIINFAKKLNLNTVAEGVESKKQIEILKDLGCDYLQGYYFAKPMPFEEFKLKIKKN